MVLRATQNYVEVVGQDVSDLRVTQHYAEVLSGAVSDLLVTQHYIEVLCFPADLIVPPQYKEGDLPNPEDLVIIEPIGDLHHTIRHYRPNVVVPIVPSVQFTFSKRNMRVSQIVKIREKIEIKWNIRNMRVITEAVLRQAFGYLKIDPSTNCAYTPMIGSSDYPDNPPTPSSEAPVLGYGVLQLGYPHDAEEFDLEITLRNPQMGDNNSVEFNRINRQTRGGTIVVFSDPSWPKRQKLQVEISALSEDQVQDFFDFMQATLGKLVRLNDWEGRSWHGVIASPEPDKTDSGGQCRNVLRFEFIGHLV